MMEWNGDGSWGGWWWPGALFMLGFMVFCMWMMVRMMSHGSHSADGSHGTYGEPHGLGSGRPEHILDERLARGEIDVEEYERRLAVLRQRTHAAKT